MNSITVTLDSALKWGAALIAIGVGWATMKWRVNSAESKFTSLENKFNGQIESIRQEIATGKNKAVRHDERINTLEKDMSVIRNDLEHIKATQTEIRDMLLNRLKPE